MEPQKKPRLTIRPIERMDDLSGFDSGNQTLDEWLRRHALANERLYGTTHVAVDGGRIVGFVVVSATSVERKAVRGQGGPSTYSALLIGRMAVLKPLQGKGIGKQLLAHALAKAIEQHMLSGCAAVVVDAKPEAVAFYEGLGFKRMRVPSDAPASDLIKVYMSIETVLAAAEPEAIELPEEDEEL